MFYHQVIFQVQHVDVNPHSASVTGDIQHGYNLKKWGLVSVASLLQGTACYGDEDKEQAVQSRA